MSRRPVDQWFSATSLEERHRAYAYLRDNEPVHRSILRCWVVSRFEDCQLVLRSPSFRTWPRFLGGYGDAAKQSSRRASRAWLFLLYTEPPDHGPLRGAIGEAFTSVQARMRDQIVQLAERYLVEAMQEPSADLLGGLARRLPVSVVGNLVGVPITEFERLAGLVDRAAECLNPLASRAVLDDVDAAIDEFVDVVDPLLVAGGANGDMLSAFAQWIQDTAPIDGADPRLLALMNLIFFYGAALETTSGLIASCLHHLWGDESRRAQLVEDDRRIRRFVEEVLRLESPVQMTDRITRETVNLHGQQIDAGQSVTVLIGAANLDPTRFPDPNAIDLDGPRSPGLGFGGGIHACLGASLARLEANAIVAAVLHHWDLVQDRDLRFERRPHRTLNVYDELVASKR